MRMLLWGWTLLGLAAFVGVLGSTRTVELPVPEPEVTVRTVQLPEPEPTVGVAEHYSIDRITYYHAVPGQTDGDPSTSACGPTVAGQVAVSRDLFRRELKCGDVIEVWMNGERFATAVVNDTTHWRFNKTVDLLAPVGVHYSWGKSSGYIISRENQ